LVRALEEQEFIIIGSDGFIGRHFCRALPKALAIGKADLDLSKPNIRFSTQGRRYALIAAGIGNPRRCEADPAYSHQCNVIGTLELGKELSKRGVMPIFLSTDYVYDDGLNIAPVNAYGKQKLEMEIEALQLGGLILRLSKVYGLEKGDGTLFDEMAAKLSRGEAISVAHDQIFAPIYVGDVIKQATHYLEKEMRGIFDVAGPSFASRLTMAKKLAHHLKVNDRLVKPISLNDLNDGVRRPKYLKLSSSLSSTSWEVGMQHTVRAYAT
jgi:dTDP-4-dehydrorhamnose reductase